MKNQKEIWKDIPNYEGLYQVSSLGRVKRLKSVVVKKSGQKLFIDEINLKPSKTVDGGYFYVGLSGLTKRKMFKVHQLVAMAFLGHKPCGMKLVVDHINNDKLDNRVENLQIITSRENTSKDRFRKKSKSKYLGVFVRGKKYYSVIYINGKSIYLGEFNNEKIAAAVYLNALEKITT